MPTAIRNTTMKEAYEKLGKNLYMGVVVRAYEQGFWFSRQSEAIQKKQIRAVLYEATQDDPLKEAALYAGCKVPRRQWAEEIRKTVVAIAERAIRKPRKASIQQDDTLRLAIEARLATRVEQKIRTAFAELEVFRKNDPQIILERVGTNEVWKGYSRIHSQKYPYAPAYWTMELRIPKDFFQTVVDKGLFRPEPNAWVLAAKPRLTNGWYVRCMRSVKRGYGVTMHSGILRKRADGTLQLDTSGEAEAECNKAIYAEGESNE